MNVGQVKLKTRSEGQNKEKPCELNRSYIIYPIFMKFCQMFIGQDSQKLGSLCYNTSLNDFKALFLYWTGGSKNKVGKKNLVNTVMKPFYSCVANCLRWTV